MPPGLSQYLPLIGGGAAILLAILILVRRRRSRGVFKTNYLPGVEKLLRAGRYSEAADLALKADRLEEAIDYFLRAQQPSRAAHVAVKKGELARAAELFERAGNKARAAQLYQQAGQGERARALKAELPSAAGGKPSEPSAQQRFATGQEAEAMLAAGNIRGAAEAFRDAELYNEAIHLFVNVLGLPGEAAPLVAQMGNHERAAELYELAGEKERAAAAWMDIAQKNKEPEQFAKKILKLSQETGLRFLEDLTHTRSPKQQPELHYLYGVSLARAGVADRAIEVLSRLDQTVGDYKDVRVWIAQLQNGAPAQPARAAPPQAPEPQMRRLSVEVPQIVLKHDLRAEDLARIAREAAVAAAEEVRRSSLFGRVDHTYIADTKIRAQAPVGLDAAPLPPLLCDSAVQAARTGPTVATLEKFLIGRVYDLQNIEVYYRLGLAHLAWGRWRDALSVFEKVDEASPGYRDAWKRAAEIKGWQDKLTPHLTAIGIAGRPASSDGRFELAGELGRGGMAVVYRATDRVLGRDVALKFLSDELMAKSEIVEMFKREARSVAQLNHPNIVTIYDFGMLEERFYIAMEYVEGTTVRDLIQSKNTSRWWRACASLASCSTRSTSHIAARSSTATSSRPT